MHPVQLLIKNRIPWHLFFLFLVLLSVQVTHSPQVIFAQTKSNYAQSNSEDIHAIIDDFIVNYDSISPDQQYPDIAKDNIGNFVITWQDWRNGNFDIYAQRYDPMGNPLSSNFKVSDDTGTFTQGNPAVTLNGTKNFVIVWQDNRSGNYDIYIQRLDSLGISLGPNFKVNDDTGSAEQSYPSIASDSSGNFVITWEDTRNGNDDIYAQVYNSTGVPSGPNFKVNDDTGSKDQGVPSISMNGRGQFTISWQDYRNGNLDIYAQRFDSFGNPIGHNFRVNDDTGSAHQFSPATAMDAAGNSVITWTDSRNGYSDIYAQRYDSSGSAIGSNFKVNEPWVAVYMEHSDVAMNRSGSFVVTWDFYWTGTSYRYLYAQRFDSSGAPLGTNFKVNDLLQSTWQHFPAIAMDDSSKFVITWQDLRNGNWDIYAQRYKPSGAYFSSNFKVSDNTRLSGTSDQMYPAIAVDGSGDFIITWEDWRCGEYCPYIYAQRYSYAGTPLDTNFRVDSILGIAPSVAMNSSGNFIVVWRDYQCQYVGHSTPPICWSDDVHARRYSRFGTPLGPSFRVNDIVGSADGAYPSAIALDSYDNFIITWLDYRNNNLDGNVDIYAQRYDSYGTPVGINFKVNDDTGIAGQNYPAVGIDGFGNSIITWLDQRNGWWPDIYAQRYNSVGASVGADFKVNENIANQVRTHPVIAVSRSGRSIIAWENTRTAEDSSYILAQRLDPSGNREGPSIIVNSSYVVTDWWQPAIASDDSGNFVLAWSDYQCNINQTACFSDDVYAQKYSSSGILAGGPYLIPDERYAASSQVYPSVAVNNSSIFFTWMDSRKGNWDIYAKVVDWNWTKVEDEQNAGLPKSFELSQNYPNPFNPITTIPFQAGSSEQVAGRPIHTTLKIYNILGQKVRTLVDEEKAPGNYKVIWDGKDNSGREVTSGIYFYQLKTKDYTNTKKMVLLR